MLWLLYGYLFLFIFRPFEYAPWIGELHIERAYMIVLMAGVLVSRRKTLKPQGISWIILAFLAALMISSAFAIYPERAFGATFDYFKLVVFYAVVVLTLNDERDVKNFITAYLAIMSLYVGKSAWEFFVHDRHVFRMGIRRMTGIDDTYGDPNAFAASIVYSVPFVGVVLGRVWEGAKEKVLAVAYALLAATCVVYTGSRSGVATAVLFGIMVALGKGRRFLKGVALLIMLFLAWNILPESYRLRFESALGRDTGQVGAVASAEGRLVSLKHGVEVFKRNPIVGIGPDNYRYSWDDVREGMNAHNMYAQLLAETGLLGTLTFIAFLGVLFRSHGAIIARGRGSRVGRERVSEDDSVLGVRFLAHVSVACVQTAVLLLFNGNFGHNLYRYNWLWIAALGVVGAYASKRHDPASPGKFGSAGIVQV